MISPSMEGIEYQRYSEYWNSAVQKIDEIQKEIDVSVQNLENQYPDFETLFFRIERLVGVLSSIYSNYNILHGRDHILKLKALLALYKGRYTREGIDFGLMNNLLSKISKLRSLDVENFPTLKHDLMYTATPAMVPESDYYDSLSCKWISFRRRRSWFIVPFKYCDIIDARDCIITEAGNEEIRITLSGSEHTAKNLFSKYYKIEEPPRYYISINNNKCIFAASQLGKRVFSRINIIKPLITPFPDNKHFAMFPGRVKIFGRSHIYLDI